MEVAKITSKGQITIPIDIRKKLGVREGSKVVFIENEGKIVVANAAKVALSELCKAFEGVAEEAGFKTEQDVVDYCKEIRQEMWDSRYANDD